MLAYEEAFIGVDGSYDDLCEETARSTSIHPEFVALLQLVEECSSVKAIILTSGIKRVWDKIVQREQLSVLVIGGNRISDKYIVSKDVKAAIVSHLQTKHGKQVIAFGDNPIDIPMLQVADTSFIVTGPESSRSKTMDAELSKAIAEGLTIRQILLPSNVSPRALVSHVQSVDMKSSTFINELFGTSISKLEPDRTIYNNKGAQHIMSTATRSRSIVGMQLREAHRSNAKLLAIEYLPSILGVEKYRMPHICDGLPDADGYQILHGDKSTIVAIMRAGEVMAAGVADVLPKAMFVHAKDESDLTLKHIEGQYSIVLVDGVVNTGQTIKEFVGHIRSLHASIRIIVICGVLQAKALNNDQFQDYGNLKFVALRESATKYTGSGGNDTGNQLFNTTHLTKDDK